MTFKPDPEFEALQERFVAARTAAVPDLMEIRRCKNRVYEYLADCALEIMEADRIEAIFPTRPASGLEVICNESPALGTPRGPCSPVKTDEIRRFEESARSVFGDIESCTTAWNISPGANERLDY